MSKTKTVLVAMSGGVDSSITAALLKEQGYQVVGVTMQIWPADAPSPAGESGCCSLSAVDDARRVASALGIPYYVMNFRDLFAEKVISYFLEEYMAGRTPNPCVACNQFIKFEALLQKALSLGVDCIATGHYARIEFNEQLKRWTLRKATDQTKDQTYVLYGMTQAQLSLTLMPLGTLKKVEVRRLAGEMKLAVADKAESQEICFVQKDYRDYLKEVAGDRIKPGLFLDMHGRPVGEHQGLPFYTIGQRKGLGLALGRPVYVVDMDPARNVVVVGDHEDLFCDCLTAAQNNLVMFERLTQPLEVQAKIRYRAPVSPATILPLDGGRVKVLFQSPQRAVTPGQSIVYYIDELVAGGGVIETRGSVK